MPATAQNMIFVTAATERNPEYYVVAATARKNDVFVHFLRTDTNPPDFWGMKMRTLYNHLRRQKEYGKKYFVFFDAYDVIFLRHRDEILQRFNEVYDGRVIFNADYPRSLYPYTRSEAAFAHDELGAAWLTDHIQNGDMETSRLLNAGLFAGRVDHGLTLLETAAQVQRDFALRRLGSPIAARLYEDLSAIKLHSDDQMTLWMTMLHYPELFHIDTSKEFLAVAATKFMMKDDLESYRKTTPSRPLKDGTCIGDAVILHSAGGCWRNMGFVYRHNLYEPMTWKAR